MIGAPWTPEIEVAVGANGANSGRPSDLIRDAQIASARNVSLRGARAHSAPRIVKRMDLPSGLLQGASGFRALDAILVSVAGRIYEVNPTKWSTTELTSDNDRGSAKCHRHWYCETVGSIVVQDDQMYPAIYDGDRFRRANPYEFDVPVGSAMAFANGRLHVAVNRGFDVRVGDIRKPEHQSELEFTETFSLLGGGDFALPSRVTALTPLPVLDTGSGQGSMIVGRRKGISTLKTQLTQRSLWSEVSLGTDLFPDVGIVGPDAVAVVNQDLYFRAIDGLRSLRSTTTDYESPGLVPLSGDVQNRLGHDFEPFLEDASVAYFDNRIFCTHSPIRYGPKSIATGLVVLNADTLSSLGQKAAPVFEGEWDGLLISKLFVAEIHGTTRLFVLGCDVSGQNGLWEVLAEREQPIDTDTTTEHSIVTRRFSGGGSGLLELKRVDLWLSGLRGNCSLSVKFRPDNFPYWVDLDSAQFTAQRPAPLKQYRRPYRTRWSTISPPDFTVPGIDQPINVGHGFEIRVAWTGEATIDRMQVNTEPKVETEIADNQTSEFPALDTPPSGTSDIPYWYHHDHHVIP